MQQDQGFWPADMYMEGLDQYRGWFQSSLLTAVGALGKGAPFKECVTHGWTVDGEGKAMHKSLGNGVDPAEIFKKYGADLLRLWAASADYHVDVRCSDDIFKQLSQNYLKFRNTARYCLGNLDGFDPDHLVSPEEMLELDRWAVTKPQRADPKVLCQPTTTTSSMWSPTPSTTSAWWSSAQLLSGHHQGPSVLRGSGQPGAPHRSDRSVPDPGHHYQAVRPHPGLHLRRNLAGHASPRG